MVLRTMNKTRVLKNLAISSICEAITLILGLILPRVILIAWGSEYNGLISSVTNILRYLSLLEAGINTATLQALYKAVGTGDKEQTKVIVRTSQKYYHQFSFVYSIIVCGIAFTYPFFVSTTIAYFEVVLIILLQGAAGVINFAFRASYQQLLNAEGKYYVISLITLLTTVLTYSAKIVAVKVFNSVLIMQVMGVLIILLQISIYSIYFHKKYYWMDKNAATDRSLIKNRKYYLIQQAAGLVFNSTDTIVLSIVCGLKVASVYAVYNMVYVALAQIIALIRSSTNFVLGQSFHVNKSLFMEVYDAYSIMQTTIGGIMSSISIILIIPFVKLYTDGISDVNYIDYLAGIIFSFNLILECSRGTSLASANIAGKAPQTTNRYVIEALLNLFSSLILVQFMGLKGVLLGTAIAGLYRTIDSIMYTNHFVFNRKATSEFKTIIISIALFLVFTYVGYIGWIGPVNNYVELIIKAIAVALVVSIVYGLIIVMLNRKRIKVLFGLIFKKQRS